MGAGSIFYKKGTAYINNLAIAFFNKKTFANGYSIV